MAVQRAITKLGSDACRKTISLFLGLALGDVFVILFWLRIYSLP